jgi:putative SOS response-associated peptidase YedK
MRSVGHPGHPLPTPRSVYNYAECVCGRTTSTTPRDTLAQLLDVDEVDAPELPISWNVAPTQPVYATVATSSNGGLSGGKITLSPPNSSNKERF